MVLVNNPNHGVGVVVVVVVVFVVVVVDVDVVVDVHGCYCCFCRCCVINTVQLGPVAIIMRYCNGKSHVGVKRKGDQGRQRLKAAR